MFDDSVLELQTDKSMAPTEAKVVDDTTQPCVLKTLNGKKVHVAWKSKQSHWQGSISYDEKDVYVFVDAGLVGPEGWVCLGYLNEKPINDRDFENVSWYELKMISGFVVL